MNPVEHYMTKEQAAPVIQKKNILRIGIPLEHQYGETRVPLVPESVGMLIRQGHSIVLEHGSGHKAGFLDIEYAEAGATLCGNPNEAFACDIVLKVTPPSLEEIKMLEQRRTLISALHLWGRDKQYFSSLMKKKATAISYESIRDKTGRFPVMQSISEIVGNGCILIAGNILADPELGKGVMLGGFPGITPTEVVIIGAGTVGQAAARTALQLGATIKVFDDNIYKLRDLSYHLHQPVFTSVIQDKVLCKALKTADVVIGALYHQKNNCPFIVPEEIVKEMKEGAVIIDVSIDQGGVFETSVQTDHKNSVYVKHGVAHYCVPNIASRYPRTSSYVLSNYFTPLLSRLSDYNNLNQFIINEHRFQEAVYVYQGILTHRGVSEKFNLPGQDINLLMAAF